MLGLTKNQRAVGGTPKSASTSAASGSLVLSKGSTSQPAARKQAAVAPFVPRDALTGAEVKKVGFSMLPSFGEGSSATAAPRADVALALNSLYGDATAKENVSSLLMQVVSNANAEGGWEIAGAKTHVRSLLATKKKLTALETQSRQIGEELNTAPRVRVHLRASTQLGISNPAYQHLSANSSTPMASLAESVAAVMSRHPHDGECFRAFAKASESVLQLADSRWTFDVTRTSLAGCEYVLLRAHGYLDLRWSDLTGKQFAGEVLAAAWADMTPECAAYIARTSARFEFEWREGPLKGKTLERPFAWARSGAPHFVGVQTGALNCMGGMRKDYGLQGFDNQSYFKLVDVFEPSDPVPLQRGAYARLPADFKPHFGGLRSGLTNLATAFENIVPVVKKVKADLVSDEADVVRKLLKPTRAELRKARAEAQVKEERRAMTKAQLNDFEFWQGFAEVPSTERGSTALLVELGRANAVRVEALSKNTRSRLGVSTTTGRAKHVIRDKSEQEVSDQQDTATKRAHNYHQAMRRLVRKAKRMSAATIAHSLGLVADTVLPITLRTALKRRFDKDDGCGRVLSTLRKQCFLPLEFSQVQSLLSKTTGLSPDLRVGVSRRCERLFAAPLSKRDSTYAQRTQPNK